MHSLHPFRAVDILDDDVKCSRILIVVLDQESAGWTRLIFVINKGFLDKLVLALSVHIEDLRFVLAMYKINTNLERLGDFAESIARFSVNLPEGEPIDPELVKIARVEEMLHELLGMISLAQEAFEKESSEIASRIFLKDNIIDEINHDSTPLIAQYIEAHPGSALAGLYMAGVIRKMERFGDHCTNIAEELIFYLDAKVMKHIGKTEEK